MKTWVWWLVGTAVAFCIALAIRLPFFGQVPTGLNRDEAALGYNALSLLKTGHDEYGTSWPVSITSFGDQKLPGYVYLLIPFISAFGVHIWSVRLPSLLAGLLLIFELGYVTYQVCQNLRASPRFTWLASMLAMIFLAISPWANHFSRVAYEAHVALALFVLGILTYQVAVESKTKVWLQRSMWILTSATWSTTMLTYHSYQILVPLMVIALLMLDWRRILQADKIGLIVGSFFAVITLMLLFFGGVIQGDQTKSQGITPFKPAIIEQRYVAFRNELPYNGSVIGKLLFNRPAELTTTFVQNYLMVFSANFFFVQGSGHGDHNPGHINNLPLFLAPAIILGFLFLWTKRNVTVSRRLFAWVMLAAVPAALTIQPQHEVRLSPIFPILTLIAALGCAALLEDIQGKWLRRATIGMLMYLILVSTLRSTFTYVDLVPQQIQSNERYHLLAKTLMKYQPIGTPVITNNQTNSPYIWYLFESQYDSIQYRQKVERYPTDSEGFMHVKRIDNIYFQNINWDALSIWADSKVLYLVLSPRDFPDDKHKNQHIFHLEDIADSKGQVVYQVWKWDRRAKVN